MERTSLSSCSSCFRLTSKFLITILKDVPDVARLIFPIFRLGFISFILFFSCFL
jgi:hypothetical protein